MSATYIELAPSVPPSTCSPALLEELIRQGRARRVAFGAPATAPHWTRQQQTPVPLARPIFHCPKVSHPQTHIRPALGQALSAARLEAATAERDRLLGILRYAGQTDAAVIRRCLADPRCTPELASRLVLDHRRDQARAALAALAGDESAFRAPSAVTGGSEGGSGAGGVAARVLSVVAALHPTAAR